MKNLLQIFTFLIMGIYANAQLIVPTPTSVNVLCNSGSSGSITINGVSGGMPPYFYRMLPSSSGSSINTFLGLSAGTYTIEIKDNAATPNVINKVVTITEPAPLLFTSSTVVETGCCFSGFSVTTIGGTPPFSFSTNGPNGYFDPNFKIIFSDNNSNCNWNILFSSFIKDANSCKIDLSTVYANSVTNNYPVSFYGGIGFPGAASGYTITNESAPGLSDGKIEGVTATNINTGTRFFRIYNTLTPFSFIFPTNVWPTTVDFLNLTAGTYVIETSWEPSFGANTSPFVPICLDSISATIIVATPILCGTSPISTTYPIIATGGTTANSSSILPASMSGQTIIVDAFGTLNIDVNTNWTGCTIVMLEDASITVQTGVNFDISTCNFSGCNYLWKGIDIKNGAACNANQCVFKDAKVAIEFRVGCNASNIIGNTFTDNYLGIFRRQTTATLSSFPVSISNNIFKNSTVSGSLKNDISTINPNTLLDGSFGLLSSTISSHSYAGIYIKYANTIATNISNNTFTEMNNGAILYQCESSTFTNNQFANILAKYTTGSIRGVGIYNTGFFINNNLLKVIGSNITTITEFLNCDYGIRNLNANLEVRKNKFTTTKFSCILNNAGINLRNNIIVDSNTMKDFKDFGVYTKWNTSLQTPTVKIKFNKFTLNSIAAATKTAIHVEGPSFAGSNIFKTDSSSIFGNTITIPNLTSAKNGIVVKWMKDSRIIKNTININTGINAVGIDLIQATNNNTSCNTINSGIATTPISTTGIRASDAVTAALASSIIRCNSITKMRRCIQILGTISTPLSLVANTMIIGQQGIEIAATANIGNQILNGNIWLGATWLGSTGKLLCLAPITFTCSSPGIWDPSPLATAGIVITSTIASANCQQAPQCGATFFKTDETENEVTDLFIPTEVITLYPNPAAASINIRNIMADKSSDIFIYDLQGRLMIQTPNTGEYQTISLEKLASGTFILKIKVNDEMIIKKFIKQ